MARTGISYEEVAVVAEKLLAATGVVPTHRAIRIELGGTGSATTIHRHLSQWSAQRVARVAPAPSELPADVVRSINAALHAAMTTAKGAAAEELARAARAADELADEGAKLEKELVEAQEQVRLLTSEADKLHGRSAEQAAELERSRARVHELEQACSQAERELAVAGAARASSEAREQIAARELAELRARFEQVLEREGHLRAELAARDSDLRAAQQAQVAAIERAKLQWKLEVKAAPKGKS